MNEYGIENETIAIKFQGASKTPSPIKQILYELTFSELVKELLIEEVFVEQEDGTYQFNDEINQELEDLESVVSNSNSKVSKPAGQSAIVKPEPFVS